MAESHVDDPSDNVPDGDHEVGAPGPDGVGPESVGPESVGPDGGASDGGAEPFVAPVRSDGADGVGAYGDGVANVGPAAAAEPADPAVTAVRGAVGQLDGIDQAPLTEHADRYERVHGALQDVLADTDPGLGRA